MFNRLITTILPIILFVAWEILIRWPSAFFYVFFTVVILSLSATLRLSDFRIKRKDTWLLLAPIILLVIFNTIFLLFLNNIWLQQAVALIMAVACYYFLRYLYSFLHQITAYKPLSLETSSTYFIIVSYLFLGISIYGFMNFLNTRLWYLAIILVAVTFLSSYQIFWINKINDKQNLFASILLSMLMVEFFWSVSFFPVSHFISGLGLAIIYYVIINLSILYFLEKIDKKTVRMYLTIGLSCLFIILLSARWL